MTDLTKIDRPFGELPRKEQISLFNAHLDYEVIEFLNGTGSWIAVVQPGFMPKTIYRVQPAPLTKPSINWDHVAPNFVAMTRDAGRRGFLYECAPRIYEDFWNGGHRIICSDAFASYIPGTCDWKDSLVLRPVTK